MQKAPYPLLDRAGKNPFIPIASKKLGVADWAPSAVGFRAELRTRTAEIYRVGNTLVSADALPARSLDNVTNRIPSTGPASPAEV
ncbi:hypothetical protein SAMN05421642_12740 [Rhodococcoides kyotonense]|uniref:Uncharacterized protein n=1 Tax=Rhodococcoides kyotonense TaxID=398843 RepID=A0A239N236_9NOCA|nr:hypothetical protein SAMN05421642_12740 [Rhodococcus kyotonensis]